MTKNIDLSRVEGMTCTFHSPSTVPDENFEINSGVRLRLEQMFSELHNSTPPELEAMFDTSLSHFSLPPKTKQGISSRDTLRCLMNEVYSLTDKVGDRAAQKLEEVIKEFTSWCSSELTRQANNTPTPSKKRKYVPMSQDSYDGSQKHVFNTHNMP